ncbi:MAG: hypothetical protein KC933_27525 [Myxococcales bacterium]|nr:hypothetical protein [Myxococcales bacterium]
MTADALALDLGSRDDDPDATWVDLLRGRRGRTLPEAATAFLPAAQTRCLAIGGGPQRGASSEGRAKGPTEGQAHHRPAVPAAVVPAEATRMGALVPDPSTPEVRTPAPRAHPTADVRTVLAYREPKRPVSAPNADSAVVALPDSAIVEVAPDPLSVMSLEFADDDDPGLTGPRGGDQALSSRPGQGGGLPHSPLGPGQPDPLDPWGADTRLRRQGTPVVRGVPEAPRRDSGLAVALGTPAGVGRALPPNVPTWAACRTQLEGIGEWMGAPHASPCPAPINPAVPPHHRNPVARVVSVARPQAVTPTLVTPVSGYSHVRLERKSTFAEVAPFALVLVAITLATAALVGAYL